MYNDNNEVKKAIDKTNRELFRLEAIIDGDPNKLKSYLDELKIHTSIEDGYLRARCKACKSQTLLIQTQATHWRFTCKACDCQKSRYDNLIGLIRMFKGGKPHDALALLKNAIEKPVAEKYADDLITFGKYEGKRFRDAAYNYLVWAFLNVQCISVQQRERLRIYLYGDDVKAA